MSILPETSTLPCGCEPGDDGCAGAGVCCTHDPRGCCHPNGYLAGYEAGYKAAQAEAERSPSAPPLPWTR